MRWKVCVMPREASEDPAFSLHPPISVGVEMEGEPILSVFRPFLPIYPDPVLHHEGPCGYMLESPSFVSHQGSLGQP